ncbi:MAG: beta strand repeat-containing protein, partial [Cyanobium sp.]
SYGPSSSTAGGIAYIDSFNWNSATPCFVYNTGVIGVSEAVSHEVGHTLGLSHDGTQSGSSYYSGHGSGENGWASIMGVGYYQSVTTWDDGTFYNSNNNTASANYNRGPDDLGVITGINGFGYLTDQEGNDQANANALSIQSGNISQNGTIETRSDVDWYSFSLANTGSINLTFDPDRYRAFIDSDGIWGGSVNPYYAKVSDINGGTAWADNGANLDLAVELYTSSNLLVGSSNPAGLAASLNLTNLAADTYYLKLDGVGFGTPTVNPPTGYSDYGSLGSYLISGTISGAAAQSQISLSLGSTFSVSEDGAAVLAYTFTRTGEIAAALSVNVTLGGTATNSVDYTITDGALGTVTFLAGQSTATVTVDPTGDTTQESDETVSLQITSGSGYTVATTSPVTGTISNDDVPNVTLSVSPASVTEDGAPNLIYTVSRSTTSAEALVVSYTVGGSATLGVDYTGPSTSGSVKTITIAANASSASLTVNPTTDTVFEADETVTLSLFSGFGYGIGTTAPVVGTITNDDLPSITLAVAPASVTENGGASLLYTFTRQGLNTSPLTVNFSVEGTASNGVDYSTIGSSITFAAGSSTANLSVLPTKDTSYEADETVALTLLANSSYQIGTSGAVVGTITNDDLPSITLAVAPASVTENSGSSLVYTFTREGLNTSPLTVNFSIGGTASNGVDYSTIGSSITFVAGSNTATLTVTPLSDAEVEADETVELTLLSDPNYAVGTSGAVVGTLISVDLPLISLTLDTASVQEDGGIPLRFIFQRDSGSLEALTVSYSVGGTASPDIDYAALAGTITFEAGATQAVLEVLPTADSEMESDETVALSLIEGSTYRANSTDAVVGTITNDDSPRMSLSLDPAAVDEDGSANLVYRLDRTGPTTDTLVVDVAVGGTAINGVDYGSIGTSVTFAPGESFTTLTIDPLTDADI